MRRALIKVGITAIVSTAMVGSLAVPTIASVGVQRGTSVLAATSIERVRIVNFAFKPKTLTVSKGTKVTWTNRGSVNHTTTSNKGLWDSGLLAPGETFSRVFQRVGTFMYHCSVHASMVGKIVVS